MDLTLDAEEIALLILAGCDEVERQTREMLDMAPEIVGAVVDNASRVSPLPVPEDVKDAAKALLLDEINEAAEAIYAQIEVFRTAARSVGRPSVLRAAADRLESDIMKESNRLGEEMLASALKGLDNSSWDSNATDNYDCAFTQQSRAVDSVHGIGKTLSDVLNDMASSIEQFFSDLKLSFSGFLVAALGLVLAVVTIETAILPIVGLIVAIIGFGYGVYSLVMMFKSEMERHSSVLEELKSIDALDWPRSVFAQ